MQWKDTQLIGETLANLYPDVDPLKLRFTELHAMVVALDDFDDVPIRARKPFWKRFCRHGLMSVRSGYAF